MRAPGLVIGFASLTCAASVQAQAVGEFDPHVQVSADASKSSLQLNWQSMDNAAAFSISRRAGGAGPWQAVTDLPGNATSWLDSPIELGKTYEYRVSRSGNDGTVGAGYVLAGAEVPFPEVGVVALLVSANSVAGYGERLTRLEADLRAEGWLVAREEVEPAEPPAQVRARLQALQATFGSRLHAALLLGQIPQPYSGLQNPDGHPEHRGAWPADTYYSDLDGTWTDEQDLGGPDTGVLEPPKGRPVPMINRAGDGKFDQDEIPSDLDIAVGRIDGRDMPGYAPLTATDLENRYLDNNHAFRTGEIVFERRTSVTDLLNVFNGNPLARMAYRDSAAVFGQKPEEVGPGNGFFEALESPGPGLAFAISYGHVDGSDAIGLNQPFKNRAASAFFLGAFGSFFGDWSTTNNLLRDAIFHPGAILGANWCNWPDNHYHQLGALWTIGETLRISFNNDHQDQTRHARGKHSGLMGDPTLRLFVTKAPAALVATPGASGVELSWQPPAAQELRGYHVLRSSLDGAEAEVRLTPTPLTAAAYVDQSTQPGAGYRYRVVAVELVQTGSGTFENHSPGALVTIEGAPAGTGGVGGGGGSAEHPAGSPNALAPSGGGLGGSASTGGEGLRATPTAAGAESASCACRLPTRASGNRLGLLAALIATAASLRRQRSQRKR